MAEMKDGCVKSVRGPLTPAEEPAPQAGAELLREVKKIQARIGSGSPDFEALESLHE